MRGFRGEKGLVYGAVPGRPGSDVEVTTSSVSRQVVRATDFRAEGLFREEAALLRAEKDQSSLFAFQPRTPRSRRTRG